jgi:hypothetical protein
MDPVNDPCDGEAHLRSVLYKRSIGRTGFGMWKLECGHLARLSNVIHCEGCGATLVLCPICAERTVL